MWEKYLDFEEGEDWLGAWTGEGKVGRDLRKIEIFSLYLVKDRIIRGLIQYSNWKWYL